VVAETVRVTVLTRLRIDPGGDDPAVRLDDASERDRVDRVEERGDLPAITEAGIQRAVGREARHADRVRERGGAGDAEADDSPVGAGASPPAAVRTMPPTPNVRSRTPLGS
jgi:hypothetical protein